MPAQPTAAEMAEADYLQNFEVNEPVAAFLGVVSDDDDDDDDDGAGGAGGADDDDDDDGDSRSCPRPGG